MGRWGRKYAHPERAGAVSSDLISLSRMALLAARPPELESRGRDLWANWITIQLVLTAHLRPISENTSLGRGKRFPKVIFSITFLRITCES